MEISSVGVLGSGQMGNGIAQVVASSDIKVTLLDLNTEFLERGLLSIKNSLNKLASKQKISEQEVKATLSNISISTEFSSISGCDLVIEAIPEIPELKFKTFSELDEICKDKTILATNTSSISINEIAKCTSRPDRVIGMHFMNPVPIMKLVEIINGNSTSSEVSEAIVSLTEKLGKIPLSCNDSPGFVSNRILCPMINEAIFTLQEGVADPEAIDGIMKLGMNHPIGPLALADLIGLDTILNIMRVLHEGFNDDKYAPANLLIKMVAENKLGRKTGIGFYKY